MDSANTTANIFSEIARTSQLFTTGKKTAHQKAFQLGLRHVKDYIQDRFLSYPHEILSFYRNRYINSTAFRVLIPKFTICYTKFYEVVPAGGKENLEHLNIKVNSYQKKYSRLVFQSFN